MHKKLQINRSVLVMVFVVLVVVSFLAGYLYALKVVGDDRLKEFDAIENRNNDLI